MICLSKVRRITDIPPKLDSFVFVNTLNWFPNNRLVVNDVTISSYEVTPYELKCSGFTYEGDKMVQVDGLFENVYQGAKLYSRVYPQNQSYNGVTTWSYPEEHHLMDNKVTPSYWNWRKAVMTNPHPIRYPNGYQGRHECVCALWPDSTGTALRSSWHQLDYVEGRKKIYCTLYRDAVVRTSAYSQLKALREQAPLCAAVNLQFSDVDVPSGHTIVTQDLYDRYLHDTRYAFGHTWSLAALLLGLESHLT